MSRRKPDGKAWSVKQFNTMIQKGTILFTHPLQRPAGQWEDKDKSLLIDSLLTLYCPDVFAIKEKTENGNVYSIIDGLQRLSTISNFLADKFTLTELKPFCLEITGEQEYNISGKKFSELPEVVQNEITSYMLGIKVFEVEEGDDEEEIIEEIFYRLNNGKGMSKEHKALVRTSHNVQKFCHRITTEHKLFTELAQYSDSAIKKSDIQMTIMQTLVLIAGLSYESFAAKHIEETLSKKDITDQVLDLTEQAFSAIVDTFKDVSDDKEGNKIKKFIVKVNIPIMAYLFANSTDHVETAKKLLQYVSKDIKSGDKYKRFTGAGSVKKEKVAGRIKSLIEICEVEKILTESIQTIEEPEIIQDGGAKINQALQSLNEQMGKLKAREYNKQDQDNEKDIDATEQDVNSIMNIINNEVA